MPDDPADAARSPRVLMVACYYPPDLGGLAQQTRLLARELARAGTDVSVVTIRLPGQPALESPDGVPVHRQVPLLMGDGYRRRFLVWLPFLIWHLVTRRAEYDVVHVHQAQFHASVAVLIGRLLGKTTLVKVAGGGKVGNVACMKRWPFGMLGLRAISRADCVLTLSDEITQELASVGIGPERVRYVPNGVELDFPPADPAALELAGGPVVLMAGRLSAEKGVDDLIHAWPAVRAQAPDARLVLLGDGPQRGELTELAKRLGVAGSIEFRGAVAPEVVRRYLSCASVFVLASRDEGMSNALLEAMSAGRPCLTSDAPGNVLLIRTGENCLSFRTGDRADLAEKLGRLLADAPLRDRLGATARAEVERDYSIAAVARRFRALYTELVRGKERAGPSRARA